MPRVTKVIVDYLDGSHEEFLCNNSVVERGVLHMLNDKTEYLVPMFGNVRRTESFYVEVDEKGNEV